MKPLLISSPRRGAEKGATLIEVLVSITVLSIGLLGIAALVTLGLRGTQEAGLRGTAMEAAQEMMDLMKANPPVIHNNSNSGAVADWTTSAYNDAGWIPTGALPIDCAAVVCTRAQQADYTRRTWARSVERRFGPQAAAQVQVCATTTGGTAFANTCTLAANNLTPYVIRIRWNERPMNAAQGAAPIPQFYAVSFYPLP